MEVAAKPVENHVAHSRASKLKGIRTADLRDCSDQIFRALREHHVVVLRYAGFENFFGYGDDGEAHGGAIVLVGHDVGFPEELQDGRALVALVEIFWVLIEGHAIHVLEHGVDNVGIIVVIEIEHWAVGDGELRAQTALEERRP